MNDFEISFLIINELSEFLSNYMWVYPKFVYNEFSNKLACEA